MAKSPGRVEMYAPSIRGLWNVLVRKPGLIAIGAANLWGRMESHRLKKQGEGYCGAPEQLTVIATDICNLQCPMCHLGFSAAPGDRRGLAGHMRQEVFHRLINETPASTFVSFTGGEPLLHPDITEFVALAHAQKRMTTLTTNGTLLAKKAHELRDAGLDLLVVSVDGPQAVHDHIRGAGSFERLAEGLRSILDLPNRPIVFVSMAISDLNFGQLTGMYEIAQDWQVDGLNYNHLWMQTSEMVAAFKSEYGPLFDAEEVAWDLQPEMVDTDRVADSLASIARRASTKRLLVTQTPYLNRSQIRLWYSQPWRFVKWTTTRCAWTRLRVWSDGGVRGCRDWTVGNVTDHTVDEVWNGARLRKFRRVLADHGAIPVCARCCYMAYR